MSVVMLTAYEAAIQAASEEIGTIAARAIELYEASRKRVQLTPEQARAFEERIEVLECNVSSVVAQTGLS